MASLEHVKALVGTWTGHSSLWLQPGTPAFESASTATISVVAGGKVVMLDYEWAHEGEPQDGRILLAVDEVDGVHMAWCDSFHMGAKLLDLLGDADADVMAATAAWGDPGAEPWGWRIELEPMATDRFRMRMYNILPASMGGMEALAVQADYVRA